MNMSASPTRDEMRDDIADEVRRRLNEVSDSDIAEVDDAGKLASSMMALVPRATTFGELIGPVYSTKALSAMWGGMSRAGVSKRVSEGKLLALKVERENLFPLFQFQGTEIREDVIALVRILRPEADPFTIAQWLVAPLEDCGGRSAIELLDAGDRASADKAAKKAARRWAM
ncbi:hypothetical protein [Microbacterium sp.]|uniref:hypothetical protein n=1 Tax=Microbacterium sp. TaxID=51671 RepID=UPI003F971011